LARSPCPRTGLAGGRTAGVSTATQRPALTIAGPMASAACKTAVDRANAVLATTV
jgi:hypothetical protein